MMSLTYCENCGVVLADNFNRSSETQDLFIIGKDSIFKYLEKRKYAIHQYWADIEQTIHSYIKWCPICKEVKYFEEVV